MSYDDFKEIFIKVLNLHAPMKKKLVRGNNAPFMNKYLSKAFMHRSKLKIGTIKILQKQITCYIRNKEIFV